MATTIFPRFLLSRPWPLFVTKPPVQAYCCCILSKRDYNSSSIVNRHSVSKFNSGQHHKNSLFRRRGAPLVRLFSQDKIEPKKREEEPEKLSLFKRFKQMYRDYWYVLVPVHLVTSAAWFGGFYYLASSGVDIPALLETMNFNEKIVNSMRNSSMGYVAITYGLYKIATPIRYTLTLGGTTLSINFLRKWGYIKPMPSKERLKEIYAETKEGMKEKRENLMESVQSLQKSVKDTQEGIKGKKDSIVSSVKGPKRSFKCKR